MSEIINLRQVRKRRLRAEQDQTASEHRAKFGRTKGEKKRAAAEADRDGRRLDQARLKPSGTTLAEPYPADLGPVAGMRLGSCPDKWEPQEELSGTRAAALSG